MKRSEKIYLGIGCGVIAATMIAFAVWAVFYVRYVNAFWAEKMQEGHYSGVDTIGWPNILDILFFAVFFLAPALLAEFSLLRNGRIFWVEEPSPVRQVCCAVSTLLIFGAAGVCFYFSRINDSEELLFLIWGLIAASLLLGGKGFAGRRKRT